jgi:membrane protein implicated in regulation of membrane protease activity
MGSLKQSDEETQLPDSEMSDLVGVWVTLGIGGWFAAILVAFFFIGPVVGIVATLGGAVISLLLFVRFIRRSEQPQPPHS